MECWNERLGARRYSAGEQSTAYIYYLGGRLKLVGRTQPDGKFVLYYAADQSGNGGSHCIGAAVGDDAHGPYTPEATALSCNTAQGGAIDPAGFVDTDGTGRKDDPSMGLPSLMHVFIVWVVWKIDGNSIGHGGNCNNGVAPIVPTVSLQGVYSAADVPKTDVAAPSPSCCNS